MTKGGEIEKKELHAVAAAASATPADRNTLIY